MSKKHFQSLFGSLEILDEEDHAPVEKVALDAYEKQTGFQLPQSYRDFIQVFGPGTLTDDKYRIAAPGRDPEDNSFDLESMNAFTQEVFEEGHEPGDSVLRLHYFGEEGNTADYFGWDPNDVTDSKTHEYGIYIVEHGYDHLGSKKVAETFQEFVEKRCLGKGHFEAYMMDEDEIADEEEWRNFQPAYPVEVRDPAYEVTHRLEKKLERHGNIFSPEDWEELYGELRIIEPEGEPVPKPTDADLDAYEKKIGLPLPRGYRKFIKVFGPGKLSGTLWFAVPGDGTGERHYDLTTLKEWYETEYRPVALTWEGANESEKEKLERLQVIGINEEGEPLTWDPGWNESAYPEEFEFIVPCEEDGELHFRSYGRMDELVIYDFVREQTAEEFPEDVRRTYEIAVK